MSYTGFSLEESYPHAGMQSVYSTARVDWAILLKSVRNIWNSITMCKHSIIIMNSLNHIFDFY